MKKKTIEKINIITSFSAIIISLISFIFSYYSYRDSQAEKLNIIANNIYLDYETKILKHSDHVIVPIYWEMLIINNGDKPITITDFSVENTDKKETLFVSYFYDGLFSKFEKFDGQKIDLPLTISNGECKKIYMRVSILCDKRATDVLNQKNELDNELFEKGKLIKIKKVEKQLFESGIDYFDNKVITTYDNGRFVSQETNIERQQEIKVSFKSAKNSLFEKKFYVYMGDQQ